MAIYNVTEKQFIPSTVEEVWSFISSPANLKLITPDYLGFEILTPEIPEQMYPGLIIAYKVSPVFGIKLTWVTEIKHLKEGEYFVDEQLVGPYKLWHHQHLITSVPGGVMMTDIVYYQPPFGILGRIANRFAIRRQLRAIFDFRRKRIVEIFGQ